MKVMVMMQCAGSDEDRIQPDSSGATAMFEAMTTYNEALVKAGVMLDGNGLLPSAKGARVKFASGSTSVVDGPFTETKELIGGYWIWQVSSFEEAVEWARRCPSDPTGGIAQTLELRQIAEVEDFGEAFTPELAQREARMMEQIKRQQDA